jgi:hypothetical protein
MTPRMTIASSSRAPRPRRGSPARWVDVGSNRWWPAPIAAPRVEEVSVPRVKPRMQGLDENWHVIGK